MSEKAGLQKKLAASDEKVADAERRIQEFEYNREILDEMATEVDETAAKLKGSNEDVLFLKDRVSERRNRFLEKGISSSGEQEHVPVLVRN